MSKIDLSKGQIEKLIEAIQKEIPINLRFKFNQIKGNKGVDLKLNATQKKKIEKAIKNNKGIVLKLSKAHIKTMKKGGILPILAALAPVAVALLSGAAGAAGTFGTTKLLNKIFPDKEGKGLVPPGYTGQTGNAIFEINKPKITTGGRRDATKPPKPAMRHYQDWLTPEEIERVARRNTTDNNMDMTESELRQRKIIRESEEIRKREEESRKTEEEEQKRTLELFNQMLQKVNLGQGLQPFGNGLTPFGTALNPIGVRPKIKGSALFPHGVKPRGRF